MWERHLVILAMLGLPSRDLVKSLTWSLSLGPAIPFFLLVLWNNCWFSWLQLCTLLLIYQFRICFSTCWIEVTQAVHASRSRKRTEQIALTDRLAVVCILTAELFAFSDLHLKWFHQSWEACRTCFACLQVHGIHTRTNYSPEQV